MQALTTVKTDCYGLHQGADALHLVSYPEPDFVPIKHGAG